MTVSFDLITQPWVPCVDGKGRPLELGLAETLARSHELRELTGESPLVTAALHRLLLAILHRVFGPPGYDDWRALWEAGRFDAAALDAYFDRWRDRFDLFHPTRPFYQAADSRVAPASVTTLTMDMASGADATLFDHHTMRDDVMFSPAQAARAMLALQSFGFCGTKGPTMQFTDAPWAREVVFLVAGESLFQTLLLNLFKYPDEQVLGTGPRDAPAWEMPDPFADNRAIPRGYLDYLTWQNRRVLLYPEDRNGSVGICQVTVAPGLRLADGVFDPMKHYSVKGKKRSIVPKRFTEERALWRDSSVLFHLQSTEEQALRAFQWLSGLVFEELLPSDQAFSYMAFGICSELGKDKTHFYRAEHMPLTLAYLRRRDLVNDLDMVLTLADDVGRQLWGAARSMALFVLAPQADAESARQPAGEDLSRIMAPWGVERRYWSRLELPFRNTLERLPQDREAALIEWRKTLRHIAWDAFEAAAEDVETDARHMKAAVEGRGQLAAGLAKLGL